MSQMPEPDGKPPFWAVKSLEEMNGEEWESLCDGCARCCLVKLEDEDTGKIHLTDIGCTLLDGQGCRCKDYDNRQAKVPDCVRLDPHQVRTLPWLPPTCAYRLLAEGKALEWWHPLVSGDPGTVHAAGISVRDKVFASEDDLPLADYPDRIRAWPGRRPRKSRA